MKKITSKLGFATVIAALIVAGLTFAPSAYACPQGSDVCTCDNLWEPDDPGGEPGPGQARCYNHIVNDNGMVMYCGTCTLQPGKKRLLFPGSSICQL